MSRPPKWQRFDIWVFFGALVGLGIAVGAYLFVRFVIFGNPTTTGAITQGDIISATATVLGGFTIGGVAVMQFRKHKWAEYQAKMDEDTRTGERLSKAIEHLGNDELHIRLGAIYELKRLADDSKRDREAIGQILLRFIHSKTKGKVYKYEHPIVGALEGLNDFFDFEHPYVGSYDLFIENHPLEQDVETAIHMLSYWAKNFGGLSATNLNLEGIRLQCAELMFAQLNGIRLENAHLEFANLGYAHLAGVGFYRAHLEDATFYGAHLEGADFEDAHLEGADFRKARFNDYTSFCIYAHIDAHTRFDPGVREKYFPNFGKEKESGAED